LYFFIGPYFNEKIGLIIAPTTSFPGSLFYPPSPGGGKMRDPGNEVVAPIWGLLATRLISASISHFERVSSDHDWNYTS